MKLCPCGCGKPVRHGNRYAARTCPRRPRVAGPGITISGPRRKDAAAQAADSWWARPALHADRSAFMAEATQQHPGCTPPIKFGIARSVGGQDDL